MDLKPFFLTTTYSDTEQQDMVKMLLEKCLPSKFYEHVKKPENFEIMNSGKINFKQAKQIVHAYVQLSDVWQDVAKNQSIYQYTYALLFPLNYLQSNKYGIKARNGFSLCYSEWLNDKFKKEQEQNIWLKIHLTLRFMKIKHVIHLNKNLLKIILKSNLLPKASQRH